MNAPARQSAAAVAALLTIGLVAAGCSAAGSGDPARGEQLHAVCLPCHGTSLYTSPQRKIKSLPALHQEVARWGDYYNPALTEQDINDVTAYLNTHFYKF
jgi:mono/diheme cytochrome c family protein